MRGTPPSPDTIERVATLRSRGLSFSEIGKALGITKDAAQGISKHHLRVAPPIAEDVKLTHYPSIVTEVWGDCAIAACVHVPEVDPRMWERLLGIGQRDHLPTLILAGDLVTGDMFSKWMAAGQIPEWSFDAELETLRRYLVDALDVFPTLVILPGNHVRNRIVRVSGGHIRLAHMIAMTGLSDELRERIKTTDLDYVRLRSGDETFLVAHSSNYSKVDGSVPVKYATTHETHVIAGNGHRTGMQVSPSGRWYGWDIGTLAEPGYMSYANAALTLYPRMLKSFATVRNGAVQLYGEGLPLTDWEVELS